LKKVLVKYSIFVSLIIIVGFFGCGIKGNPVKATNVPYNVRIVQNLKATAFDNEVLLGGDVYSKDSKISYIAIEKSELESTVNECKDCPKTYERIGQISVKEIRKENKGYNNFSFTDKKVTHGKIYNYRLLVYDNFNTCFEKAVTEINFK
jgi:hypothetical protein